MRAAAVALLVLALAGCGLRDPYAAPSAAPSSRAPASPAAPAVRSAVERGPLASAREFARGYLPYLYGLGPARAIGAVRTALRRSLEAQPMTREDGASPSHPQLAALRLLERTGDQARARAIVTDDSGVYFALDLGLVRARRGWQVAALRTGAH